VKAYPSLQTKIYKTWSHLLTEIQYWMINIEPITSALAVLTHVRRADVISLWRAKGLASYKLEHVISQLPTTKYADGSTITPRTRMLFASYVRESVKGEVSWRAGEERGLSLATAGLSNSSHGVTAVSFRPWPTFRNIKMYSSIPTYRCKLLSYMSIRSWSYVNSVVVPAVHSGRAV
jgi:hypothetical protein